MSGRVVFRDAFPKQLFKQNLMRFAKVFLSIFPSTDLGEGTAGQGGMLLMLTFSPEAILLNAEGFPIYFYSAARRQSSRNYVGIYL